MLKHSDDEAGRSGRKSAADGPDLSELTDALGYVLRRAQLAVFKSFKETFKGTGITPAQYSVLTIIDRNPGLKQNQISDALGIKHANFVPLLNSLETRGLAQRTAARDRRSHALQLTPRGRKLLAKLRELSDLHEAKIRAPISAADYAKLIALLRAVTEPLENDGEG